MWLETSTTAWVIEHDRATDNERRACLRNSNMAANRPYRATLFAELSSTWRPDDVNQHSRYRATLVHLLIIIVVFMMEAVSTLKRR
jgi:hypothetical protein